MQLTLAQRKEFRAALLSAFRDQKALEHMVYFQLDENLNSLVDSGNLESIVSDLIKWAETRGYVERLIRASTEENPTNPELRMFADTMLPLSLTAVDDVVLRLAGDAVMALNADVPSSSFDMYLRAAAIIEQAKQQGITADAVRESLAVLGEQQYLTRHDYRGEPAYAHFAFTVQGFAHYGRKYLPNYATLVDRVAAHLVNAGDDESIVVARALGQSHMLIKPMLRWLGQRK